jgi:hypothetical protein
MTWMERLEGHLAEMREYPRGVCKTVTGATVHEEPAPGGVWVYEETGSGWAVEERVTPCGNIALHLFPSAG